MHNRKMTVLGYLIDSDYAASDDAELDATDPKLAQAAADFLVAARQTFFDRIWVIDERGVVIGDYREWHDFVVNEDLIVEEDEEDD